MHGDAAHKLTLHAKRTLALPTLPPYQTELVRNVVREVAHLDASVSAILAPYSVSGGFNPAQDPATACTLLVNHLAMRRNKRCLLAYHRVRAGKLEEGCWSDGGSRAGVAEMTTAAGQQQHRSRSKRMGGGNADGEGQDGHGAESNISPEEEEYVRQYAELLAAYKGAWTDIDLTGSLEPPRDLFIDVRVLKDAGEIETEYGSLLLSENSQLYVRQGDVERLITQGYLQRLS